MPDETIRRGFSASKNPQKVRVPRNKQSSKLVFAENLNVAVGVIAPLPVKDTGELLATVVGVSLNTINKNKVLERCDNTQLYNYDQGSHPVLSENSHRKSLRSLPF